MKFLFWLGIGFDRHGPSVHLLSMMIKECLEAGHEVVMIVRNTGGEDPDIPVMLQGYKGLTCEVISDKLQKKSALVKRYFEDIWYFFRSIPLLHKHKDVDAVFLQSCTAPIFPIVLNKMFVKKPLLFNVQNIFPNDALVLGKLSKTGIKGVAYTFFRKMQQIAYRMSDQLVTISHDMNQTLLDEGAPADRLSIVYNWSYTDDAVDIADDENLFLKAHHVDRNKFRVVFSGNLGAMVNAEMIADAAKALVVVEDIHFFIIGAGNNMELLKRRAQEDGLKNMSFYPYQPEEFATHNYAMAHININTLPKGIIFTCMPSKTATCLNSARPMVVSVEKESYLGQMLSKVDKCTVVDVDDVQGFTDAILKHYKENVTVNSENAREIFKQVCSVENAKQYVRVLEKMAK